MTAGRCQLFSHTVAQAQVSDHGLLLRMEIQVSAPWQWGGLWSGPGRCVCPSEKGRVGAEPANEPCRCLEGSEGEAKSLPSLL